MKLGFTEIAEFPLSRPGHDPGEMQGIAGGPEFIEEQDLRALAAHVIEIRRQMRGIWRAPRLRGGRKGFEDLVDATAAGTKSAEGLDHLRSLAPQRPAGQGVVADAGDPTVPQAAAGEVEQGGFDRIRGPRQHAVGEDVIEAAVLRIPFGEIRMLEGDVLESGGLRGPARLADRGIGEIDPEEAAFRKPCGEREKVVTRGAADLEHLAVLRQGRVDDSAAARRSADRARMSLGMGQRRVAVLGIKLADGVGHGGRMTIRPASSIPDDGRVGLHGNPGIDTRPREA